MYFNWRLEHRTRPSKSIMLKFAINFGKAWQDSVYDSNIFNYKVRLEALTAVPCAKFLIRPRN